jgi:hypothetical protein
MSELDARCEEISTMRGALNDGNEKRGPSGFLKAQIKKAAERFNGDMEKRCTICLQPFEEPKTLACLHVFCSDCLDAWSASRGSCNVPCPLCRTEFQMVSKADVLVDGRRAPLLDAPPAVARHPGSFIEVIEEMASDELSIEQLQRSSVARSAMNRWGVSVEELQGSAEIQRLLVERVNGKMPADWQRCRAKRTFGLMRMGRGANIASGMIFYWNVATGVISVDHPHDAGHQRMLEAAREERRRARCDKYYVNARWTTVAALARGEARTRA